MNLSKEICDPIRYPSDWGYIDFYIWDRIEHSVWDSVKNELDNDWLDVAYNKIKRYKFT